MIVIDPMVSPSRRCMWVALSAVAALTGYAWLWLGYRHGGGILAAVDSGGLRAAYDVGSKSPGWVRFWDLLCTVLAPTTFRLLGAAAVVAAVLRRQLRTALFVLVSVEFTGWVTQLAKNAADRPRPVTALAASSSSSFPSGHALSAMVGVVALLAVTLPSLRRPARVAAAAVGVLTVAAVGVGRVALNVHHPSDVVAGWALGYVYVLVCLAAVRPGAGLTAQPRPRRS